VNRPATAPELAVLRHPDRATTWAIVLVATLTEPIDVDTLGARLAALAGHHPILASRWDGRRWRPGPRPVIRRVADPLPPTDPALLRFSLADEAPVRVLLAADGRRLAVVAHHAALDGRGAVALLAGLLGAPAPEAALPRIRPASSGSAVDGFRETVARLCAPADRIAASAEPPPQETFAARVIDVGGGDVMARLATACGAAARAHNARRGLSLDRIGLSVPVGGPAALGNVAGYRRLDVSAEKLGPAVVAAWLETLPVPQELRRAPRGLRLLGPVLGRLSDTLLVSNVGRVDLPGVTAVEFHPVARGRSAVAFGACGLAGGQTTLTVRARDLDRADAEALLRDAAARLAAPAPVRDSSVGLWRLHRLWRREQRHPRALYTVLAELAADDLERRHGPLAGRGVADLGCGPGWYTRAMRRRGADVLPIDVSEEELMLAGRPPPGALIADAMDLPLPDAAFDGVFSSNMLEHTPDARRVLTEIERILRPGGWAYVSWTNFFSPWGGHDMTPFHLLGARLGNAAYRRCHGGRMPKNALGVSLFATHIGPTLRYLREETALELLVVEPRYWPRLRGIVRVPLLREVLTWNCVVHLRKAPVAQRTRTVTQADRAVRDSSRTLQRP
jgi:SAM-dependent methyltransferase